MRPRPTPEGWHTVTPRIATSRPAELVQFLRQVFAAQGEYRTDRPSVLAIGDSLIMVGDAEARGAFPAFLYVYVADADAVFRSAREAGVEVIEEPFDTPYGERRATIRDPWSNVWQIASLIET